MIWMKAIGWICLACNIGLLCFVAHTQPMQILTASVAASSAALLCGLYGYQIGRDAAFADLRKFGRAFMRAKGP